ncbi:hypothetical protein C5167_030115, partial [Papaver somniferum]
MMDQGRGNIYAYGCHVDPYLLEASRFCGISNTCLGQDSVFAGSLDNIISAEKPFPAGYMRSPRVFVKKLCKGPHSVPSQGNDAPYPYL